MKDNKTILYEELSQDFEMPEYAEFSKAMDDPKRRKALYDKLLPDYDLPDFETFSNYLAAKPVLTDGEAPVLANYDVSSLPEEAWVPKAGEPSKEESSWSYIAPNPGSEFTVAPFKADERSKQVAHKPFAEEHPMGMTLSNETQVPLKPQEKFTTTYEDALPKVDMEGTIASAKQTASEVGQIGQAIAERGKEPFARESNATDLNPYKTGEQKTQENYVNQGMAQASRELRPEIQIDMELEKINAELEELEKEYYSSDAYLQSRIVKSAIPGAAKAAWDEFAYASPRIIELQKRKTALLQAKEYRAIADEISANNKKYNAVGAFFANAGVGAGAYLTGKLNSANSAHRTDRILTDKLSLSNKIQNGEALSQSEQETMTIYALEDMMESKYGSAERNLGYIAGYGAPQMIEFMVELALSPGRGLAKAGMSAGEKLAAKTVSRLTKKYGASAVAKMLEKMGTYTLKQSGRILGATGNAMVATATTQADDLVRGTGERMAGRFVGERDAEGNLIGTSVVDTKSLGRAAYEQGATQTIENLSEAIFEGMGIGKGVSAMISKAGGKAAGTKLGGKILKGATYKTVSELMERTAAKDWYQATSKVMKAMHLGSFPEEVMEEYAAIPMKHWAGVSESGMTLGEELLSPETFYTTMAGLSLGMGGMTAVSVAPATISAGIDIYNSRKAHKALRKSDAVGASVFGAEWADIKSRVESIREEDFGIEMATLLEEYETEEQKSAIYDYMIRLQYDRGYNQMRRKAKEEQEGQEDAGQRMEEAYEEGYDMEDPQARNEAKSRLDEVTALYGETIEESIAKFGGAVEFLRNLEGKVSQETMDIVTEYINLKETVKGIQDSQEDNVEARIEAMHKDVANRTHKQSGAIVTTQLLDEQGNVMLDPNTGAPVSFYVVDADMAVDVAKGSVSAGEGSAILRDANGKLVMVDNKRLAQLTPVDAETVKAQNEATIRAEVEAEVNAEAPTEEAIQVPTETSSVPTLEVLTRELEQTEFGKTALTHIDMMMEQGEDAETINQTIDNEYGSLAPKLKAYYQAKANAIAETAMAEQSIAQQEQEQIAAQEVEKESHIIRDKDDALDVEGMIKAGVTPEQMTEIFVSEFDGEDPGLALSTAQEYLAQVQEERAKTKNISAKNGPLRKKEQFWSNVVGILTPQQEETPVTETPVTETPVTETPVAEAPQAEVPAEAQNANAKWQAAPKVYGRETTLRVKGMRLRGRYVVAPAGVAAGSHTADFEDNADFIHDEQGRSRNPRKYNLAANQAAVIEGSGKFALENVQVVSPHGIVYDGSGRQAMGDRAARQGTDGIYLEDLMDRADEFGFTPEQIQGMEHPRVYFEVAPGQLDYSAQTFDKFNAPEMKAPSAVELGAAMGQVLSDETFNRLADTIKQSGGLSAVYKSKPLQETIAYILRDASDVKDVTTATLPQYYNADTRTLTEAGRNLLEACLLGKIFADNPQVLALLPKLPNKVMSKVAQAMPELAANMQMGEYALKDELANALTLVYEASQSGASMNDYATQQDWTKGGSATDIFGKTVVMLAKALNGEIEGAELADVVRAYNVKAVDVVTGQGSMFETPTREQMLQEVINYYIKGEVATEEEEVATEESAPVTEESAPVTEESAPVTEESAPQQEEVVAQPKTRVEKVNAMSDEEFSALLASNDLEAMRAYEQELHAMRGIDEAEREEYNRRSAKLAAIKAEFGEFDNAPASVRNEYLKMSEEIEAKYSVDKVVERQDKLSTRIFEVEAQRAREEEQREKEEKENYRKTAHNGFLAEKTPMGAAKADKALNKQYRVDGKVNTVAGFVEAWNEEGPMELRVQQNGNKSQYLVNGYDFGKTAYDYAQYLQSKKQQEATSKEASSSSDSSISEKVETARGMLKEYDKAHAEWVDAVDNARDREAATESYIQKQKDFRTFLMTLSEEELETVSSIDSTAEEEVKKEERRRHHQAELAEDYEKALSSQGEITPVAPKAKGSIFDATVKDETRPVFGGVYHKGGTAVATDGKILIEEKGAYEQEKEGQLVDKKGNVIEGQRFPNWRGVTPKDVEAFGVSMESLRSFVEGVRQDAKKNGKKEADVTVVVKLPNGNFAYFKLPHLVKFTNAAYRLGATELMLSPREEAPLLVQTEKGTAMLMPLLRASEEMYAYEISGKETEETAPAEQKAESVSHEELVEQNKQELSSYANRDLNALIKKIKEAMPHLQARVERAEEGSEERQDAEAELKKWSAVLEAAESLLDEHKNGGWKKQFAAPLSESKELSIEDVKALFESLNGDKAVGELFEKVYAVAKTLGLKIKISDQLSTAQGNAGNDGIVKYAASLFYLPHSDQERANTLLHELIHTCTMYATGLHAKRNNGGVLTSLYDGLPQEIKDACAELEEIYNNIKNDKRVAGEYGITSVNEMVAELSNPVFREKMKEISLWGKIVGAIKRLFGFEAFAPEGSEVSNALAEAERVLVKMLDNFDKSTYDAIKDKLQRSGRGRSNAVLGERLNAYSGKRDKAYGADNPYRNKDKATFEEREEIIRIVKKNKYDKVGTDIIRVGDTLFLTDHTDAEDLLNLYNNGIIPDGQGYGIRKKYNFASINKEDIYEITRNIAESYNFDANGIRNRLQELGIKPGDLLELDIAIELARGNRNNGVGIGASRRSGREVDADRSSSTSGKDKGEVLGETEEEGILYRLSDEIDAEYMDAVSSGDMETAQRMVDDVLADAGYTIRGEHGTTHKFTIFSNVNANIENSFGKGFYFTSDPADAKVNYSHDEGPDLANRIELLAEQLEYADGYEGMDYDERKEAARQRLSGGENIVISAALAMDNPCIFSIDPEGQYEETIFDIEEDYDEETDEYGEPTGLLVDFVEALNEVLAEGDYYGADSVDTSELLFEGEYTADQLKKRVGQMLVYIEDEDGGMASNEIFRAALERMGFDGIIDNAPSLRFQNMGLGRETKHYIVFSPNQVKQSDAVTYDNEGNVIPLSKRANRADKDMRYRQGDGRYTDEELALINDPAARLYGESFRTKKQQKQYAERVRNHMRKKATELAEKLHLPVEIIESEEDMAKLQGKKAKAKGWYEVKSGKIVLVLPNNESVADIVETVLHEGVAHLGLRKLFGKQFTQFLDNVYNHAEQSIREKIDEIARKNKVSTRTATEEYLASLAETTDFENINAKWWSQIKKFFLDMLHTIGFDYKGGTISDSELRYILWRSHENLKEPNPRFNVFSQAKDIVKQNKLKAEEKQAKERRRILSLGKTDSNPLVADRVNEEETLYRMGDANNPNETAQRVYNEEMLSARFLARETMVDYLAALDSLQRIIAEKGGKITSFQDAYSRMLALSSRNKQEIDLFDYSVMPELTKAIGEILGRTGKINWESPEAKTLQRYTKVKHGIERDRDMAVRKALPAIADMKFKEQFAEINQRIEASTLRSEYEALIKERADMRANPAKYGLLTAEQIEGSLEAEWYKRTDKIRAEKGTWKEKQQKMDKAIAEVFGLDQVGLNAFGLDLTEDYSGITETLVNEGLLTRKEVRKDRYAARKKAYEFVEQYEKRVGQYKADGLWNAIKAVSGFALEKQRQCGLVSAKYVADCNKRFEFYVPLRGFNEDVAHDVYDYLDDAYNNNNPVQTAKGRESEAGNPFANLMNIGYRSITAGNHNLAVQAFWNLANRKDVKGFLVPSRVWHLAELTPEQQDFVREELRGIADLSNDDILPYLPENASAEEIQDLLDDFEETMKRLKAMGYAYQGSRKAKQELRTLSKAEENAHRVKVYVNGEARYVTVVGNPRAAQALNGQLNPEQADWAALKGLQNFLAGAFTSQNPSFALANLVRDTQHANMRAFITENPEYWRTLTKKQAKFWRLGAIMKMLAAYENSIGNTGRHGWGETLDPKNEMHMRFKRFMEQGGATGFTFSRKQHENLEKLAKMAENVEGKSAPGRGFVVGEFFDAIRTFTEASELVNRFAAYETSLEMGRTEQQAIRDAKEITLNFNRKGAGRATYNASRASGNKAYTNAKYSAVNGLANLSQFGRDNLIFWNASVQGAYQLWSMLKKHPVKTLIAYGAVPYTLAAFGLPLFNALLCGGDDDKYYDELPEYERQRNICIKIPGTKGWFKIPLDPATQKIWAMGEATGAVMRGKKELNLWNDIGANFVGLFSPVDIYWGDKNQNIVQRALSVGSSFTPTLAQPLLHTFANRDWKGKPLENNSRYLDHLPSYKKAFKSDKTSLTELSKWMNEWANEDADTYKVGPLDFASPGVMEELLFGYTGGYGQAALAAVETAWSLVSDEARGKFQWDKQPIINRFWVEGNPGQTKRTVFMNYNKEVGDFMEEVEQRRSAINRDIKNAAIRQDDTDYGKAIDARTKFLNSTDWKKYVKLKAADAQVRQEAKGGIENASDITISAMLEAIEMIHDDKAFEANEQ